MKDNTKLTKYKDTWVKQCSDYNDELDKIELLRRQYERKKRMKEDTDDPINS